ncbi:MAG TPA: hypothetical protein VKG24_01880 [Pseudolabrys sp.]|nr:hypothetical protein [Pseudolabrys sp.]
MLETRISASPTEYPPHLVEISRQELTGEVQRQRFAEIELSFVRYRQVVLIIFVRHLTFRLVQFGQFRMPMDFARLSAQKAPPMLTKSKASRISLKLTGIGVSRTKAQPQQARRRPSNHSVTRMQWMPTIGFL